MTLELAVCRDAGDILAARCMVADSFSTRLRGLIGRELKEDEALFFSTNAIHTSFMRYDIDVVFLDGDRNVIDIAHSLRPWRFVARRKAQSVIELPAGTCKAVGLTIGETLLLVPAGNAAIGRRGGEPNGKRLQVTVASEDGRFLRVASFLLARQGFEVEAKRDVELVEPGNKEDVILLDGSGSLAAAARVVKRLTATSPGTGVVVVSDSVQPDRELPRSLQVLPKWESFDRIVEQILLATAEEAREIA